MASPSPSTRKRIGRGVRNFDSGVGDRDKQDAGESRCKIIPSWALATSFLLNPAVWTQGQ